MSTVQVSVDRTSRTPLHVQLAQQLEAAIQGGDLPVGSRLSNEVDLAEAYGLSRPTVRQAIARLVDQGLLVRKRGVGTQVVGNSGQVRRSLELTSLYDDLSAAHRKPETEVLRFGIAPAERGRGRSPPVRAGRSRTALGTPPPSRWRTTGPHAQLAAA